METILSYSHIATEIFTLSHSVHFSYIIELAGILNKINLLADKNTNIHIKEDKKMLNALSSFKIIIKKHFY